MRTFSNWLVTLPLKQNLADARKHLGRALVLHNSNRPGLELHRHMEAFKDSLYTAANKTGQGDDDALARDVSAVLDSLCKEADAAISESDPGQRRWLLSNLLSRIDSEIDRSVMPVRNDDIPLGS